LFSVQVDVQLRAGIADPAGATIERSLPTLGFDGVSGVKVGKSIRFSIDASDEAAARSEVDDLCHRFLTNPVIEESVVTIAEMSGSPA
jgi:phosphoribosylformylglycinamidine synthase